MQLVGMHGVQLELELEQNLPIRLIQLAKKIWTKSWAVLYRNKLYWVDGCWMDGWMLDGWMDVGWMVGESGIKANSAQFSWSLAELGNILVFQPPVKRVLKLFTYFSVHFSFLNLK